MDLEKLMAFALSVVLAFAAVERLDVLQRWIWIEQAKLLQESRTSTWGSPRFFPDDVSTAKRDSVRKLR